MRKLALASLLVSLACTGMTTEDLGPFDVDENDDSIAGSGKADDPSSQPCVTNTAPIRALGGLIMTPAKQMGGYVVIQNDKILSVVATKAEVPAGAQIVETNAIISPGLIDLHNHVAYNYIPVWNSGKRWQNRYQWARAAGYTTAVKNPYNAVKNAAHQCEGLKYGEFRAAVGGTTSIQGSVDLACARAWVRNVEFWNFCQDKIRQNVLPINGISAADAAELNAQFTSGKTSAFLVHLAEGIDDSSRAEFEQLRGLGLLKPQVVGIHSTALNATQLQEMGQVGMKIVWSPLSNLMLYGQTTDIITAMKAGVKVALAPDWSPSGSANLLGELKVADRVNKNHFGSALTTKQLWQMVTSVPADIAGLGDKVGSIAPGYYADLMVFTGNKRSAYRALIDAPPSAVTLTLVNGQAIYGDPALLDAMGQSGKYTSVDACGAARGLVTTTDDKKVTKGTESLTDITGTFAGDGVSSVIPLFQCDAAPDWAFPAGY